jgi:hypothetical protein
VSDDKARIGSVGGRARAARSGILIKGVIAVVVVAKMIITIMLLEILLGGVRRGQLVRRREVHGVKPQEDSRPRAGLIGESPLYALAVNRAADADEAVGDDAVGGTAEGDTVAGVPTLLEGPIPISAGAISA